MDGSALEKDKQLMTAHSIDIVHHVTPEGWRCATQEQFVSTDFGQLLVRVGGNVDGPPMVFWPSLLLDGSMWAHQFEHYAPNFRIILIDPPGIGRSAPLRRVIGVEDSATCLRQVLDALHIEKSIVVGSSWGSLTAATLAASDPARLLAVVLTNGTAASPTAEITAQMTGLVAGLEQSATAPDWLADATKQAFAGELADEQFLTYLDRVLREDPVSVAFAMKGILLGREDLHPTMRRIRDVPVLIIAGEADRVFDVAQSESLAASIAGSNFVLLPKTGHLAPLENPSAVNATIDGFLKERLASPRKTVGRT